jgi:putative glutamine amidotransferase
MRRPIIGINLDFRRKKILDVYRIKAAYVDAIYAAGGIPFLVPPLKNLDLVPYYLKQVQGFLFIGGRDYPPAWYHEPAHPKTKLLEKQRALFDLALMKAVLRSKLPLLCICGGHQLLNIACGGKLIQHLPRAKDHTDERYHHIKLVGGKILKNIFGTNPLSVNSSHHQAVDPQAVGKGLRVTACAAAGTIEAVEGTGRRFLLGVQWHPERIKFPKHREKLFTAFIRAAQQG